MPAKRKARKRDGASHPYGKPEVKPGPQNNQKNIIVQPLGVVTLLERFFSRYPKFRFQPSNSPVIEFGRLCETYDWERDDRKRRAAHKGFQSAMKKEFDDLYGSDEKDINN
ncbi:hypothetical protein BJY52DRAFT_1217670 [Lactarius psammicola]|nr:hypothetical protein BJY52DRAFT_1217670 [Lactarius psammicola]